MDEIPQDNFDGGANSFLALIPNDCIKFIRKVKCTMNELLKEEN